MPEIKDKMASIYISDGTTRAVPQDLVSPQGTIILTFDEQNFWRDGHIFLIQTDDFHFSAGVFNGRIFLRRNDQEVQIEVNQQYASPQWIGIFIGWSQTLLSVSYAIIPNTTGLPEVEKSLHTSYTTAPPSLIRWLRKRNLIETVVYDTESDFQSRVHSILASLQENVDSVLSENGFWDMLYQGGKCISRLPKKEVDVHSILHGLLLDQFLMSSIEVVPEFSMGVGRIDFMLIGSVRKSGPIKMCLEVKHAHSPDLTSGLVHQLPAYMENAGVQNGAYLVLWYGKSVGLSGANSYEELSKSLTTIQIAFLGPIMSKRIRVFTLDVTKSSTASRYES